MKIKTWGAQHFLNPADSADSGFFRISVRDNRYEGEIGFVATLMVADCEERVHLSFGISSWVDSTQEPDDELKQNLARARKQISERRKKIEMLLSSLSEFADVLEHNLSEVEKEITRIESTTQSA